MTSGGDVNRANRRALFYFKELLYCGVFVTFFRRRSRYFISAGRILLPDPELKLGYGCVYLFHIQPIPVTPSHFAVDFINWQKTVVGARHSNFLRALFCLGLLYGK